MKHDPQTLDLFEAWYSAEMPRLYNYVAYLVRDRGAAEDLTAAICERALERLHQYDSMRGNLDVWMFAIARNVVRNYFRDRRREGYTDSLDALPEIQGRGASPEEMAERAEAFHALMGYLEQLTDQEQDVIALRYGAGVSNIDIGQVVGVTPNHVGVILHRALRKLREAYQREDEHV